MKILHNKYIRNYRYAGSAVYEVGMKRARRNKIVI